MRGEIKTLVLIFFNDTATTEIYTLSLHDALPILLKIAVGPGGDGPRWTEWTDTIMKAYQHHTWSWDMNGLSMHNYTVVDWQKKFAATGFGESEYAQFLKETLKMDDLINTHAAIMDKYDPDKKVALAVAG